MATLELVLVSVAQRARGFPVYSSGNTGVPEKQSLRSTAYRFARIYSVGVPWFPVEMDLGQILR